MPPRRPTTQPSPSNLVRLAPWAGVCTGEPVDRLVLEHPRAVGERRDPRRRDRPRECSEHHARSVRGRCAVAGTSSVRQGRCPRGDRRPQSRAHRTWSASRRGRACAPGSPSTCWTTVSAAQPGRSPPTSPMWRQERRGWRSWADALGTAAAAHSTSVRCSRTDPFEVASPPKHRCRTHRGCRSSVMPPEQRCRHALAIVVEVSAATC